MDWLRRNWPDLAIGVALVAVIAGIIATLLTGGSFFPLAPTTGTTQAATPSTALPSTRGVDTLPAAPGTSPLAAPGVAPLAPGGGGPAGTAPAGALDAPADAAPGAAAGDAPTATTPSAPAATPLAPPIQPQAPGAAPTTPAPTAPAPAAPVPTPPAPTAPAPTPPAPAPQAAPTGPVPSAAADPEAPFRVAVGAFGNPDNAARQAATFRDAGYPVFTGTQGALTIVLVGPFDTEAAAEQVAGRIRSGPFGVDPVVYRFRPDATHAAAATPAPTGAAAAPPASAPAAPQAAPPAAPSAPAATPTPATPTPAPAPAAGAPTVTASSSGPVTTAASGRYLQVGAYGSVEGLTPLRDRLAALGYATTERREDGLIKLLVGPFDGDGVTRARSHLAEHGIDSFVR